MFRRKSYLKLISLQQVNKSDFDFLLRRPNRLTIIFLPFHFLPDILMVEERLNTPTSTEQINNKKYGTTIKTKLFIYLKYFECLKS